MVEALPGRPRATTSSQLADIAQLLAVIRSGQEDMAVRVDSLEQGRQGRGVVAVPALQGSQTIMQGFPPPPRRSPVGPSAGGGQGMLSAGQQVRVRFPVQAASSGRSPGQRVGQTGSGGMAGAGGAFEGDEEEMPLDEVDGDFSLVSLQNASWMQAFSGMMKTQELMASLVAERQGDPFGSAGGGGAEGSSGPSLRGPTLVQKARLAFRERPVIPWERLEVKVKEKMGWSPGESWSMEAYGKTVPWGHHKLAKRSFWILAQLHRALRADPPQLDLVKGLVAQGLKFYVQTALDHGASDAAITLLPWEDPVSSSARDPLPPPLGEGDPFSGLAEASEIATAMSWIKDTAAFAKARTERLNQGGGAWRAGNREGGEGEGGEKKDWKKEREEKKKAAAAKAAAAKAKP
jgi:hypothetical protein